MGSPALTSEEHTSLVPVWDTSRQISMRMVKHGSDDVQDYATETAVFISSLIVLYLMAVVVLIRRQIKRVTDECELDQGRVAMTDIEGQTRVRVVEKVLTSKKEIFM